MSQSAKPVTGYQVCQEMVIAIQAEVQALKQQQQSRLRGNSFAGPARMLADAITKLQGEIRKTGDDADRAVDNLSPERQVELLLGVIRRLSPEHRMVLRIHLEELGSGIL